MKFKFLKNTIRNKRFNYTPVFYDEQKEYLELKKAQYRELENQELDPETRKSILRQEMNASWSRAQHTASARRSSNMRVILLIAIIVFLGYLMLYGVDEVDTVVEKVWDKPAN